MIAITVVKAFAPQLMAVAFALIMGFGVDGARAIDPAKTVGPNACAECHKEEAEAWKGSHHFKTFRDMPRNIKANEIADKLGVRRIRTEARCVGCHFTAQQKTNIAEPIAGISCESCHGAGQDWIKLHSSFSGKTILFESASEKKARWILSQQKGMITPASYYPLAKNCFSCHVVPDEELVNKGGHKAGSALELVSWTQGEVRHNTWKSKGTQNVVASAPRRRMLYLVGLGVDLETALRAMGRAKVRWLYAFEMAKRADRARKMLDVAAKALPGVPEIAEVVKLSRSAGFKLNNEGRLTAAADAISTQLIQMTSTYDGSTMASLDPLIPGPETFKGTPRKPPG